MTILDYTAYLTQEEYDNLPSQRPQEPSDGDRWVEVSKLSYEPVMGIYSDPEGQKRRDVGIQNYLGTGMTIMHRIRIVEG